MLLALALTLAIGAVDPTPGTTPPPPRQKVCVLPLSGLGMRQEIVLMLENYLRRSIDTIEGFQALSAIDVQMQLQDPKNKDVAACGGGLECAQKTAKLVGADIVVYGSIGALGLTDDKTKAAAFSLSLRAVDVRLGKEIGRQQADITGSRDLLIPEVRLAAHRLIAPDKVRGWLVVDIDVQGADVEVDGKLVGQTPLSHPVENLLPGSHVVVIKRPGFQNFQQEFTVRPFEPTRLKISLGKR